MKDSYSCFRNKVTWLYSLLGILVIYIHSRNYALLEDGQAFLLLRAFEEVPAGLLGQTAVPGFFMISGYLFFRNYSPEKLCAKLKKRMTSLVLPYLFWNLLYYAGYLSVSRLPLLRDIAGKKDIPFSAAALFRAVFFYAFNPVFWYLFQLIFLVALTPLLWLLLKSRLTSLLFVLILSAIITSGADPTPLNSDALFYYFCAAAASRFFPGICENTASQTGAGAACGLLAVLFSCLTHFSDTPILPVLFRFLFIASVWLFLPASRLPAATTSEHINFFIYAAHFAQVRLFTKTASLFLTPLSASREGLSAAILLGLFFAMPAMIVYINTQAARQIRRFFPRLFFLLNGGRSQDIYF